MMRRRGIKNRTETSKRTGKERRGGDRNKAKGLGEGAVGSKNKTRTKGRKYKIQDRWQKM